MAKKKKNKLKLGAILFGLVFLIAAFLFFDYYQKIYKSVTSISEDKAYIYIKSDWNRTDLVNYLFSEKILADTNSFIWVANQKNYLNPKPGKYLLKSGMSNNALVNLFRSGKQEPVRLTFNTIRTFNELAGKVGGQIEADSLELINAFRNPEIAAKYGFNSLTFFTLFLPNTYEVYWNTSAEEFIKKMANEYKRFWTDERKSKAKAMGLSQSEVSILASLVQAEQMQHRDERPKVAGLYVNRLKKGMRLQSDPTLIFALGDFSIKRVLNKHKELNSPYNTYKNAGLPPGPINLPEISSLTAVLNYEKHNYLFMCAKADFSGYHNFAKTNAQHNIYANQYRRELNRRRIMK